jgi:hypothetical protein
MNIFPIRIFKDTIKILFLNSSTILLTSLAFYWDISCLMSARVQLTNFNSYLLKFDSHELYMQTPLNSKDLSEIFCMFEKFKMTIYIEE